MNDLWIQIPMALFFGYMAWRIWPAAIHMIKHGPRGSSKEWLNVSMIFAAVVLFVTFLVVIVRG